MVDHIQLLQENIHRVIRDHFLSVVGKNGKYDALVSMLASKIPVSERHFLRFLGIGGQSWPRKGDLCYLLEMLRQEGFFAALSQTKFAETIRAAFLVSGFSFREANELAERFCLAGKLPQQQLGALILGQAFWRAEPGQLFLPTRELRTARKLIDAPENRVTITQFTGVRGCGRSRMLGEILHRVETGTFYLQHYRVRGALALDAAHKPLDLRVILEQLRQFPNLPEDSQARLAGALEHGQDMARALLDALSWASDLYLLVLDNLNVEAVEPEFLDFLRGAPGQPSALRILIAPDQPLQAAESAYLNEISLGILPIEDAERLLCYKHPTLAEVEREQRRELLETLGKLPGPICEFAARCQRLHVQAIESDKLSFLARSVRDGAVPTAADLEAVRAVDSTSPEIMGAVLERLGFTQTDQPPSPHPGRETREPPSKPLIHRAFAEQLEWLVSQTAEKTIALVQRTFEHWKAAGDLSRAAQFLNAAASLGASRDTWRRDSAWIFEAQDWILEQRSWLIAQELAPGIGEVNILEITRLLLARGQTRQVIERLENISLQAEWSSDQRRIVFLQGELTANFISQADYARAREVLSAMLSATERAGDVSGQAFALTNLALVANWLVDQTTDDALRLAERALQLYATLQSHPYEIAIWTSRADCLAVMSLIHAKRGQINEACRLEAQIRKLATENHDPQRTYEAESHSREGFHYRAAGRYCEALRCHNRALQLHARHSQRQTAAQLAYRANLFLDTGRFFDALRDYEEARQIALSLQDWRAYCWISGNLGIVYLRQGDLETALKYQHEALDLSRDHSFARSQVTQLTNLAETTLSGGIWSEDTATLHMATNYLAQAFSAAAHLMNLDLVPDPLAPVEAYRRLQHWPDTPDVEMQSPGEYWRQGLILARIALYEGDMAMVSRTLEVIGQAAHRPTPHLHQFSALQGLLFAAQGAKSSAIEAFHNVLGDAQAMLDDEADYYPAQYSLALAHAGLTLLDKDPKQQLRRAQADYKKALILCDAEGVRRDAYAMLQKMKGLLDRKGVLEPLVSLFDAQKLAASH